LTQTKLVFLKQPR